MAKTYKFRKETAVLVLYHLCNLRLVVADCAILKNGRYFALEKKRFLSFIYF